MRDLLNNTKQVISLSARSTAENGGVGGEYTGNGVDRTGFDAAVLEAILGTKAGAVTGGTVTVKIQDSDDNVEFADVAGATASYSGANDTNKVLRVPYTGIKPYVRTVVTNALSGGAAGANTVIVAANFLLGHPRFAPVDQS